MAKIICILIKTELAETDCKVLFQTNGRIFIIIWFSIKKICIHTYGISKAEELKWFVSSSEPNQTLVQLSGLVAFTNPFGLKKGELIVGIAQCFKWPQ